MHKYICKYYGASKFCGPESDKCQQINKHESQIISIKAVGVDMCTLLYNTTE